MAGIGRAKAVEDFFRFGRNDFRLGEQDVRIKVALQSHLVANTTAGFADIDGPVEADRIAADVGIFSSHRPPFLVNTMLGMR